MGDAVIAGFFVGFVLGVVITLILIGIAEMDG